MGQFSYDPRAESQEASSWRPRQVLSLDAAVLPHDAPVVTVVPPPAAPFQFPAEVQLGSVQLPTVGSLGHYDGSCKPCAFFWKEAGCSNGTACSFCHLCDSMEKKGRHQSCEELQSPRYSASGGGGSSLQLSLEEPP